MMALVLAVQHWRQYLLGTRFVVYTDQKSLKFLLQQRVTTPNQQNWVAKLLGYDFEILYKPGCSNRAADALSRQAEAGQLAMLESGPVWIQGAKLVAEAQADPNIQQFMQKYSADPSKYKGYSIKQGVLFFKSRLVIATNSKYIPALLHEFHTTTTGGHSGYYRTYRRLAANLFRPGMTSTVKQFVKACEICQTCKASTVQPGGLLQPLDIPEAIWEDLSMDFIGGLPLSKGFNVILVVVDRLSKYAHFIGLKHPYTSKGVAELFVKEVIRHHGIPKTIISDRDPLFISNFWQEIFKLQGTTLQMSSAYHPETDGQTEVKPVIETPVHAARKKSLEGPSFSLGMTQDESEAPKTNDKKSGMLDVDKTEARRNPTRLKVVSKDCKSPFVQREVVIKNRYTSEEKAIWKLIFAGDNEREETQRAVWDKVFETVSEEKTEIFFLRTLEPGKRNHFYVIVFEFKNLAIYLLDNMQHGVSPVTYKDDSDYHKKSTPYKVKHFMMLYLRQWKNPKVERLLMESIQPVQLEWATTDNVTDCGIFIMRHMEMFMRSYKKFECGFKKVESQQKKQINTLRKKYASRILLSSINVHREKVLKEAGLKSD
ncbi:hypothetical protein E3N88_30876 [Mikania micrantha]|uniref:Integrase catalytic domain-containing protein n=1 Tax=Mikania micrantha TaxID=192012 RepID=A0A5N6MNN7_9ASTR|nr:hypothetical protein E3N88_30876 [Mikania micrantha]